MDSDRAPITSLQLSFGPFRLYPARQLLFEGDRQIRLGSRACNILSALVERPGEILTKQELIDRAWPNTFVEENSLRVHVAAIRRALGDGDGSRRYITNVPGRGYTFVAPVSRTHEAEPNAQLASEDAGRLQRNFPVALGHVIGRSQIVRELSEHLLRDRFITVVGPGGIGKTTVAVSVLNGLVDSFTDGVHFVDLAPVSDPQLVPGSLAALLGIAVRTSDPLPSLVAFLKGKRCLIVLDDCEHVIDAAAALAEEIFKSASGTHLIATSREPLRARGEFVYRLVPLAYPDDAAEITAEEALTFPAIRLFVELAASRLIDFELRDADAPLVADICRSLDGIPLAIEIVSAQVEAFGIAGLATRLGARLALPGQGRRTAVPRHRTLNATLDWSYDQLPEVERLVLRRLAIFAGAFTMESASAVLDATGTSVGETVDAVANLISKSLVSARVDGAIALYRLLETTRAYALAKLEGAGERERLAWLHADHFLALLAKAQAGWESRPAVEWLEQHRHLIDNLRAALDWSFSPAGDTASGVALTVAAIPLWFALSLISECSERVDRALAAPAENRSADQEMRLWAARAWSLMQTRGAGSETEAAWTEVLTRSEQLGNVDYQLRGIWGRWSSLLNKGQFRPALALAEKFTEVAARQPDTTDLLVGDRMVGYILHLLGDQVRARFHIERMLSRYQAPVIGGQIIRFVFDQRATAQCFLARILWLQGFADSATNLAKSIVDGATASGDVLSLCQTLVQAACPVAFFVGDLAAAEQHVTLLLEHSRRQALDFWQAYGRCFEGVLVIKSGRITDGLVMLTTALEQFRTIQFGVYYNVFVTEVADALGLLGSYAEGLTAIDEALARAEVNEERWYLAESLRIKGLLLLRWGGQDAAHEAEDHFRQSLDWSRRHETPAWELRASMSLADLWRRSDRIDEARKLLSSSYARFNEGRATADLQAARSLLDQLG